MVVGAKCSPLSLNCWKSSFGRRLKGGWNYMVLKEEKEEKYKMKEVGTVTRGEKMNVKIGSNVKVFPLSVMGLTSNIFK